MRRRWSVLLVASLAGVAIADPAEDPPGTSARAPAPRALCLTGKPGAACTSIFLLEASLRGGTSTTRSLDTGLLFAQGDRNSWGATIGLLEYQRGAGAAQPASATRRTA